MILSSYVVGSEVLLGLVWLGEMKARACELCNGEASLYCGSDSAFLCWSCDDTVHGANFLVARHVRLSLCSECNGLTGEKFCGAGFRSLRPICRSCSSETSSGLLDDSMSSSSSCVSTTDSAPKKGGGGVSRPRTESTGVANSTSAVSGQNTRLPAKAEGILVNWCRKLGLNGNCPALASHALGVCLDKLTGLPIRVSLAAAIWCGAKMSGDRSAYTCQNLKRLVEISRVPEKIILAGESKLARAVKIERPRHVQDQEEGWAETSG